MRTGASWSRSPAHSVTTSKECLQYLGRSDCTYNHFADMETAPQRAKQTINKLVSFALWLQVSRVTFCLLVQLWPSWWFWWTRINIIWHISLLVTDHNILALLNSLMLGIRTGLSWTKSDKLSRSSHVFDYSASEVFPLQCFLMSNTFQILPHCERDPNIWDFTRWLTKAASVPCILQHQTIIYSIAFLL